jgi:serine/threonine protein kinase
MGKVYGNRWEGVGNDLGEGGQAHVLRVKDSTGALPGEFALKRITNPKRIDRFRNEVDAIKMLVHPNIIKLIDHSALDALPNETNKQYLVMPIAGGKDLSRVVGRYQGNLNRVLVVACQIADALKAAHEKKIIHRDVKPENILFQSDGDDVWLSDFGICLITDGRSRHTAIDEVVGPTVFMAPELEGGGQPDVPQDVDVYSLGKVIYYMLSGGVKLPRETFDEERYSAILAGPGLESLRLLLMQMICFHDHRIQSMETVLERLEQIKSEREDNRMGFSADGIAALDRLKRSIADEHVKAAEQRKATAQADRLSDMVHQSILATIKAQLEESSAQIRTPGAINSEIRPAKESRPPRFRGRLMGGLELTFQDMTNPSARKYVLQFFVYCKASVGVSSKMKLGVFARLELREANDSLVTDCSAYLQRKSWSRGRYEYSVTDNLPIVWEVGLAESGNSFDDLRQFVLDTVSAFPELIRKGAQQFIVMRLRGKR